MDSKNKTNLKPYEVICPTCKGTGKLKEWKVGEFTVQPECSDCWGEGKLDWIERIVGKPPRSYEHQAIEAWVDEMAEEIKEGIDKEIIENILESCKEEKEQNKKGKEDIYDNRVFSKLLFHPIVKQKLEGKKD